MSYTVVTCPICGGEMNSRSKRCKRCTGSKTAKSRPDQIDTCPICGGLKTKVSKTCKGCQYKQAKRKHAPRRFQTPADLSVIPDDWWLAFVGLFMGEGGAGLYTAAGTALPRVCLTMSLRADDAALIEDVAEKLGGNVYYEERKDANPLIKWSVTSHRLVGPIARKMLDYCILPAKKVEDLKLIVEYLDWRYSKPHHLSDEDRRIAMQYPERMKALHAFNGAE